MCICVPYISHKHQHVTRNTIQITCKLHFILLVYITEQIWLPHPHYTYRLHCPNSLLLNVYLTLVYICAKTHPTAASTLHYINIYIPEINIASKLYTCAIYAKYLICIYGGWMFICAKYEITGINHVTRSTVHRWRQHWRRCQHRRYFPTA